VLPKELGGLGLNYPLDRITWEQRRLAKYLWYKNERGEPVATKPPKDIPFWVADAMSKAAPFRERVRQTDSAISSPLAPFEDEWEEPSLQGFLLHSLADALERGEDADSGTLGTPPPRILPKREKEVAKMLTRLSLNGDKIQLLQEQRYILARSGLNGSSILSTASEKRSSLSSGKIGS
jgi:hypothetical protein